MKNLFAGDRRIVLFDYSGFIPLHSFHSTRTIRFHSVSESFALLQQATCTDTCRLCENWFSVDSWQIDHQGLLPERLVALVRWNEFEVKEDSRKYAVYMETSDRGRNNLLHEKEHWRK